MLHISFKLISRIYMLKSPHWEIRTHRGLNIIAITRTIQQSRFLTFQQTVGIGLIPHC